MRRGAAFGLLVTGVAWWIVATIRRWWAQPFWRDRDWQS